MAAGKRLQRRGLIPIVVGLSTVVLWGATFPRAEDGVQRAAGLFRLRRGRQQQPPEEPLPAAPRGLPPGVPTAPPAGPFAAAVQPESPPSENPTLQRAEEAIRVTSRRMLNAEPIGQDSQHFPWQIMHALLAQRQSLQLRTPTGTVNAIEFISRDPVFRGEHWFEATRFGGRGHPYSIPYHFEGHVNQFLALLSMSSLPLDHKLQTSGGKVVTMADMVRHAQMTVNTHEEISWTLWFLTHYLDPEATWTNANGHAWSMEALVRLQTQDAIDDRSPCGGCHGLFALAYARNSYLQKHGKLRGVWLEGDQKLQRYIAAAQRMQNRDGSFSSQFFLNTGFSNDPTERLRTSGHMLEWLMMALPAQQLEERWVRAGVWNVANDLIRFSNQRLDPGPLYHAMHALVLYRDRLAPKTLDVAGSAKPIKPAEPQPSTPPPNRTAKRPGRSTRSIVGPDAVKPVDELPSVSPRPMPADPDDASGGAPGKAPPQSVADEERSKPKAPQTADASPVPAAPGAVPKAAPALTAAPRSDAQEAPQTPPSMFRGAFPLATAAPPGVRLPVPQAPEATRSIPDPELLTTGPGAARDMGGLAAKSQAPEAPSPNSAAPRGDAPSAGSPSGADSAVLVPPAPRDDSDEADSVPINPVLADDPPSVPELLLQPGGPRGGAKPDDPEETAPAPSVLQRPRARPITPGRPPQ